VLDYFVSYTFNLLADLYILFTSYNGPN